MKTITTALLIFILCGCTEKNTVSEKNTKTNNDSIELKSLKVDDVKTANDAFQSVPK